LKMIYFIAHRRADLAEQMAHPIEFPVEGGYSFRDVEHLVGQPISRELVFGEHGGLLGTGEHGQYRVRKQLGIAESVGHPVRGDRVLEVAGISHQRPAWTPTATHVAGCSTPSVHPVRRSGAGYTGHERP